MSVSTTSLKGWWVDTGCRNQGYGAALVAAAEAWARGLGLTEMASDADLGNERSHNAHQVGRLHDNRQTVNLEFRCTL